MQALRRIPALFPLTLPFQLSTPYGLLCHLPDKALFELAEVACLRACLVLSIQADKQTRGQHGQCDRALHALALLGHLPLPQVQPAFEFLTHHFDTPTPRVHAEDRPRARLGEIGHEDFDALRPIVTPVFWTRQ